MSGVEPTVSEAREDSTLDKRREPRAILRSMRQMSPDTCRRVNVRKLESNDMGALAPSMPKKRRVEVVELIDIFFVQEMDIQC